MKTSVVKDGNVFMVHVIEPKDLEEVKDEERKETTTELEKSETEQSEKDKSG